MHYEVSVHIDAPAERAWTALSDIEHWPDVIPTVLSVDRLEGGPLGVGSTARVRQPGMGAMVWRVTECEPGRAFTWQTRAAGTTVTGGHYLTEDPAGGLMLRLTLTQTGPTAWLIGLFSGARTRRYVSTEATSFKTWCERPAA